jgi:hypothetical protein
MGVASGIAGSSASEEQGVFLCRDESQADFFVRTNNTGGPVDVWTVTGIVLEKIQYIYPGRCHLCP